MKKIFSSFCLYKTPFPQSHAQHTALFLSQHPLYGHWTGLLIQGRASKHDSRRNENTWQILGNKDVPMTFCDLLTRFIGRIYG